VVVCKSRPHLKVKKTAAFRAIGLDNPQGSYFDSTWFLRKGKPAMNTHWQFIFLGAMILLLPSFLVAMIVLWRPPRRDRERQR
jgi:hypothetical protein